MAHVFFASYARLDNDKKRLRTVILDLRERVRGRLGAKKAEDVGFFDAEDGILAAHDWEQTLGEAARHARFLVCFCSNTYFNSEYCANEFEIFRLRLGAVGATANTYTVVLPVVWNVAAMPRAVSRYQDGATAQGFPDDYRRQGLLALRRNRTSKSQATYNATLDALTNVIEAAYNGKALPSLPAPVVFANLPGVFDNPGAYSLRIGGLHPDGLRWEPQPGRTVRYIVEQVVAAEQRPWRVLKVDDGIGASLQDAAGRREAVILIADGTAIESGAWKARAAVVDQSVNPHLRVLVGMRGVSGAAPSTNAGSARLTALLPRLAAGGQAFPFDADDLATLQKLLPEQITVVNMSMVAEDPAERLDDQGLADGALQDGFSATTRPIVAGPDGRTS